MGCDDVHSNSHDEDELEDDAEEKDVCSLSVMLPVDWSNVLKMESSDMMDRML